MHLQYSGCRYFITGIGSLQNFQRGGSKFLEYSFGGCGEMERGNQQTLTASSSQNSLMGGQAASSSQNSLMGDQAATSSQNSLTVLW